MERPCLAHGCPAYAAGGRSYCRAHIRARRSLGLTGEVRGGPGYERKRRIVFARQHGRCACGAQATILHHKRSAYDERLEDLIGVCLRCHRAAHAAGSRRRVAA